MTDMKSLLQKMIDNYQGDDIAGYIAAELEKISYTRDTIAKIQKQIVDHDKTYKEAISQLKNQIKNLQMKCKHWTVKKMGYGGADPSYYCEQCGETWDYRDTGVGYDG